MGENCKPACRGIRIQASELLDLSSSDKRLTRTHHRAWGIVSDGRNRQDRRVRDSRYRAAQHS
jgi:hypothetical protein